MNVERAIYLYRDVPVPGLMYIYIRLLPLNVLQFVMLRVLLYVVSQLQPLLGFHALVLCLLLLAPGTVSTGSHSPLFIGLPILRSIAKRQTSEVFQTRRPSLLGRSWDFHNMKYNRKR